MDAEGMLKSTNMGKVCHTPQKVIQSKSSQCTICEQSTDQISEVIQCVKCAASFHKTCAKTTDENFICALCTHIAPTLQHSSPTEHDDNKSVKSNSERKAKKLAALCEERRRLRADLDEKWKKLQEQRIEEYIAEKQLLLNASDDESSVNSSRTDEEEKVNDLMQDVRALNDSSKTMVSQANLNQTSRQETPKPSEIQKAITSHQTASENQQVSTGTMNPYTITCPQTNRIYFSSNDVTIQRMMSTQPMQPMKSSDFKLFESHPPPNLHNASGFQPSNAHSVSHDCERYGSSASNKVNALTFDNPNNARSSQPGPSQNQWNPRQELIDMGIYQQPIKKPHGNLCLECPTFQYPQELVPDVWGLTPAQQAARRTVSKELPKFSGRPEDWQFFISSYVQSTETCGLTDAENLIRLKSSLQGEALENVRNRLQNPKDVSSAVDTLRILYGSPEIIINSLLRKIRREPPPRTDNRTSLIKFAVSVQDLRITMENSDMVEYLNNPMLLQELITKLPDNMRYDWAKHRANILGPVTIATFEPWIFEISKALSGITIDVGITDRPKNTRSDAKPKDKGFVHAHENIQTGKPVKTSSSKILKCVICENKCSHPSECSSFTAMSYNERWETIKQHHLCRTCLSKHGQHCRSRRQCGKNGCHFKHHPMLHKPDTPSSDQVTKEDATQQILTHRSNQHSILFRILPIVIHGPNGSLKVYAFCDEGSSLTILDKQVAINLGIQGDIHPLCLKWTGDTHRIEKDSMKVSLSISGSTNLEKKHRIAEVRTVQHLNLPKQSLDVDQMKVMFPYMATIPIESYQDVSPQLLIGMDNIQLICALNSREGAPGQPIAIKTRLGWSVCGPLPKQSERSPTTYNFHMCECSDDRKLDQMMQEYFAIEQLCTDKSLTASESSADRRAMKLLEQSTVRKGNRFESGLLWQHDSIQLPDSRPMVEKRLQCLRSKMAKDSQLSDVMHGKIEEYIKKNYIRKLTPQEVSTTTSRTWYLLVFPVFHPKKPNKVRIVWDAAAKADGVSLNSVLLKGPDQLASLPSVLFKFRERKIAISADIQEMFHMILINQDDQHSQRFLWQHDGDEQPTVYVMQVMTFGSTSSPCTAQFVKNKNATEFIEKYPRATRSIIGNHYVDDLLDSVDTIQEAIQLAQDVKMIHARGGFNIRGWISNSKEVVESLGEPANTTIKNIRDNDQSSGMEKVLGMAWNTTADTFSFQFRSQFQNDVILTESHRPTKREILRFIMKFFDPLGLLSHFMIYAKIILQKIWLAKIDWDELISDEINGKWHNWLRYLQTIDKIEIPRCYLSNLSFSDNVNVQLHVFVDASRDAYAAASYLRVEGNHVECTLVCAKARVAPLKLLSIPRLELESAILGVRLAKNVTQFHTIKPSQRFFWSDSKTVISWIKSDVRKYRPYVAFRVAEINESTDIHEWRYIPTALNVADEATKWQKNPSFVSSSRWYVGPEFLYQSQLEWPNQCIDETTHEEEIQAHHHHASTPSNLIVPPEDFSTFKAYRRRIMYVKRFIINARSKYNSTPKRLGVFNRDDYLDAENTIYRAIQRQCFKSEISILRGNIKNEVDMKRIPKTSALIKLNPYLDEFGVLRSKGRIQSATFVPALTKTPVILPKDHYMTNLIILHYHDKFRHHNYETITNELRQVYHIPQLRSAVKKVSKTCQLCKVKKANPEPPMMSDLPPARMQPFTRPFSFIGIDYFGPMTVAVGRRHEKRWGVLITCLTTRAIHVEIAHSLSTDSCILNLRNFYARRGSPIEIHSDQGTNFIGANRELKETIKQIDQHRLAKEFTSVNTKWLFNPPAAPHMGGSWERLVQSVKKTLSAIAVTRTPTDEVLRSMLMEVENIINSRPLTYLPIESDEAEALTPNHFLLGSSNGIKPLSENQNDVAALRRNWLLSQTFANHFWRRWVKEYLPTLTRRNKWTQPTKPIEVNDIVIIVDDQSPRNSWIKGRVIETVKSSDGQVRRATVKTLHGTYQRPAVKLAVLDVQKPM